MTELALIRTITQKTLTKEEYCHSVATINSSLKYIILYFSSFTNFPLTDLQRDSLFLLKISLLKWFFTNEG